MCDHSNNTLDLRSWVEKHESEQRCASLRRRKIWEISSNAHCSIVGTCLTHKDLTRILKRCKMQVEDSVTAYDLHGHFVDQSSNDGPMSRAVQKLLDKRYAGIIRIVGHTDPQDLEALWEKEYNAGRVAGAYWALLTHDHLTEKLCRRVFGEVHMLSHVLGRTVHAGAERASELEARVLDLESRLLRQSTKHRDVLAKRDQEISDLKGSLAKVNASLAVARKGNPSKSKPRVDTTNRARVLTAARERAKRAEQQLAEVEAEARRLRALATRSEIEDQFKLALAPSECPGAAACELNVPEGETLRVLYLGGRDGAISRLRSIAENAAAEFIHHDGGKQEAFNRIEDLVEKCHVVFCPVNCVSHNACLFAKDQCKKMQKAFVPLRSSGGQTFRRALEQITE